MYFCLLEERTVLMIKRTVLLLVLFPPKISGSPLYQADDRTVLLWPLEGSLPRTLTCFGQ